MGGGNPPKPANALELGLSDKIWRLLEDCWQPRRTLRPSVKDVSSCVKAAALVCDTLPSVGGTPQQYENHDSGFTKFGGLSLHPSRSGKVKKHGRSVLSCVTCSVTLSGRHKFYRLFSSVSNFFPPRKNRLHHELLPALCKELLGLWLSWTVAMAVMAEIPVPTRRVGGWSYSFFLFLFRSTSVGSSRSFDLDCFI